MIYKFNEYINENLLKGISKGDFLSKIKNGNGVLLNTDFKQFLESKLDFNLLPRDENGFTTIDGNLRLGMKHTKNDLPDNLIIYNDLILTDSGIGKLPNKLRTVGDLEIDECGLHELPSNLIVGGNLYMVDNNISVIPPETKVKGKIYTAGNPLDIDKQPKHLKFYRY